MSFNDLGSATNQDIGVAETPTTGGTVATDAAAGGIGTRYAEQIDDKNPSFFDGKVFSMPSADGGPLTNPYIYTAETLGRTLEIPDKKLDPAVEVNIAVDFDMLSNYYTAQPSFVLDGVRINLFPLSAVICGSDNTGKKVFNVDMIVSMKDIEEIGSMYATSSLSSFPKKAFVRMDRASKYDIQHTLNRLADELQLKHFHKLSSWQMGWRGIGSDTISDNHCTPIVPPGMYLLKPSFGARGIGQWLVEAKHLSKVSHILHTLKSKVAPTEDDYRAIHIRLLNYASPLRGRERVAYEGLKQLTNELAPVVESIVSDVESEYRIITSPIHGGKPVYVNKRARSEGVDQDGYVKMPLSNVQSDLDEMIDKDAPRTWDEFILTQPDVLVKEIESLLAKLPPLQSVDLYICKKDENSADSIPKWGFFEYCSQFGYENIDISEVSKWHQIRLRQAVLDFILPEKVALSLTL